jgi:hypothetical protein
MSRGGIALPAALAAVAVSAALGAAIAELTRVELALARQRRAAMSGLVAADGCLAEVVAALPPGWDFATLLVGPDGVPGTADDGASPTPAGCTARARPAPGPLAPPRALLRVQGDSGGGSRLLDAVIGLDAAPGVPGLLWLGRSPTAATLAGTIILDGASSDPTATDWAALAAPVDPTALDAWVANAASHLVIGVRTADPIAAAPPPFASLAARTQAAGPAGAGVLVPASPAPAIAFVAGDLVVTGALAGAGFLFVDGTLDIHGALDFTGIVVAAGGVRIATGGRLEVSGALWLAAPGTSGPVLDVAGSLTVRRDADAVTTADHLLSLPRRAVLLGLKDLG